MSADQLLDMVHQAQAMAEQDRELRRQSCPHDGTPYRTGPDGQLYCPWDGYRPSEF